LQYRISTSSDIGIVVWGNSTRDRPAAYQQGTQRKQRGVVIRRNNAG
jgi:hypothetical protein